MVSLSTPITAAHVYYDIAAELARRPDAPACRQVKTAADLEALLPETEVLVISMLWQNRFLAMAPRLRYIQSISSGVDQFDLDALKACGVRLCNARGVNSRAVAEHALALLFSLSRRLYEARDNQARHRWSTTGTDPRPRLTELADKVVYVIGMGTIGDEIARLCQALGMTVLGTRHSPRPLDVPGVTQIAADDIATGLAAADHVILTCPLTEQTRHLINARTLALMKRSATLINVARGPVVEENALIAALESGALAAAALDTFDTEPLPAQSPLWSVPNLVLTGHIAGETEYYERNVVNILLKNLEALQSDAPMTNRIV
ncbi:D-2-hydroxyacid dehydrogenase [Acetobacter sp. TBRC 12305]|uniref:D-2-hydroxyacid dehydrogenase n=1 Tax=Acetobacter garciniae TaxID=2817435 RepID=A0A939HPB9_9PROT|nr:D-2-hydroxyacid dehydrogenase [Acetobacter garciniae]MBO1326121.1 D-2-hydroxyacid dehydrogenase [Acetobacter garciniae]MBX0345135.1 D-2-hydroxyacid dehydrogenase [Acetobacter garciniae]